MDNQPIKINKRVKILAVFEDNGAEARYCLPLRMRWKGRGYTFNELGLRHPTVRGQRHVHVFDVSDGKADFRLEFDSQRLTWKLLHIAEAWHE